MISMNELPDDRDPSEALSRQETEEFEAWLDKLEQEQTKNLKENLNLTGEKHAYR